MEASLVQSLFVQPRNSINDRRIAKIDETSLTKGSDGILYKMLDPLDWNKYKVLSNNEIHEENIKCKDIVDSIHLFQGKTKYSKNYHQQAKFFSPSFGELSKSKKIERRNWDQDLNNISTNINNNQYTNKDSSKNQLKSSLEVANTIQQLIKNNYKDKHLPIINNNNNPLEAMETLKNKYEQNLHVVESLYNDKTEMEEKIKLLEYKFNHIQNNLENDVIIDNDTDSDDSNSNIPLPSYEEMLGESIMNRNTTIKSINSNIKLKNRNSMSAGYVRKSYDHLIEDTERYVQKRLMAKDMERYREFKKKEIENDNNNKVFQISTKDEIFIKTKRELLLKEANQLNMSIKDYMIKLKEDLKERNQQIKIAEEKKMKLQLLLYNNMIKKQKEIRLKNNINKDIAIENANEMKDKNIINDIKKEKENYRTITIKNIEEKLKQDQENEIKLNKLNKIKKDNELKNIIKLNEEKRIKSLEKSLIEKEKYDLIENNRIKTNNNIKENRKKKVEEIKLKYIEKDKIIKETLLLESQQKLKSIIESNEINRKVSLNKSLEAKEKQDKNIESQNLLLEKNKKIKENRLEEIKNRKITEERKNKITKILNKTK